MNYSVEILPQALDNIESAYRWMANNFSPERAEQWYEELMLAVRSLEQLSCCAILSGNPTSAHRFLTVLVKLLKPQRANETFVSYL
jgi:plasmid stabilization system protein ParE